MSYKIDRCGLPWNPIYFMFERNCYYMYINQIAHAYSNFRLQINDLELPEGEIIGLLGENGAGKTTLMNMLSGYYEANQTFDVENFDVDNILYIPSDLEPYPFLTVSEFVTLIINHTGGIKTVEQVISELNLKGKEDTRIEELSQGMRKKLSLINLFIRDIGLLILDEPFNSIDVTYITQLKSILRAFKGKTTILISSHILDTLNDLCDSFVLLKNGKVDKIFANTGSIRELEEQFYD